MKHIKWLNLQLFAGEGAGDGGGEGASTGVSASGASAPQRASDDADQRLRELGVPEDKLRRRAMRRSAGPAARAVVGASPSGNPDAANGQDPQDGSNRGDAAPNPNTEDRTKVPTNVPDGTASDAQPKSRMSWDEIMADPEYNRRMQAVVRARVKKADAAVEALGKLTPALELLARKHGMDPTNMDYGALAKAIDDEDSLYEEKALEMGTSVAEAKNIDRHEREQARNQRAQEQARQEQERQQREAVRDQMLRRHFDGLVAQGEALKSTFPSFDLQTELKNPVFARLTAPGVGLSVEDAYHAVHRKEIQTAAMQVTAQKTAEKLANSIRSGGERPAESGTSGRAPSVATFNYSKASPKQREAFKADLRARWARGEKVYPGQR